MSNTYTKGYIDGSALTESQLDTAYQSLQLDIANTALTTTGSTTGQALLSNGSGVAASFQTIPDPQGPFALRNYGIKATVATGVMTISLVTKALSAPSGSDKVDFNYSTNGTTSASYSSVQVSASVTFTLNASATLGLGSGTSAQKVFVYGYYNTAAASVKLAISALPNLDKGIALSATSISASADFLYLYATASITIMPRLLGWIEAARNSSGEWQTPTKVNVTNAFPGRYVAVATQKTTTVNSTSSTAITNSISLQTTGGSVLLRLAGGALSSSTIPLIAIGNASGTSPNGFVYALHRDGSLVQYVRHAAITTNGNPWHSPTEVSFIDTPSAGTHSYKIMSYFQNTGASTIATAIALEAVEL